MTNNKGAALLELVISIGFISIVMINAFIFTNSILNKNNNLYNNQMERKTINSVYSKIAQDLYSYNIFDYAKIGNNEYMLYVYRNDKEQYEIKSIKIDSKGEGLKYAGDVIKNNSAVEFNSINIEINNNILILTINYNDGDAMKIYSINYKGE